MAGVLRKSLPHRLNRRRNNEANRPQPTVAITVQSVAAAGPGAMETINIVFSGPVTLKGVPQYTTDVAGAVPVSATMTNPTTMALTFDVDVSAATQLNVPYEDRAVRNSSGGFVAPMGVPF